MGTFGEVAVHQEMVGPGVLRGRIEHSQPLAKGKRLLVPLPMRD